MRTKKGCSGADPWTGPAWTQVPPPMPYAGSHCACCCIALAVRPNKRRLCRRDFQTQPCCIGAGKPWSRFESNISRVWWIATCWRTYKQKLQKERATQDCLGDNYMTVSFLCDGSAPARIFCFDSGLIACHCMEPLRAHGALAWALNWVTQWHGLMD